MRRRRAQCEARVLADPLPRSSSPSSGGKSRAIVSPPELKVNRPGSMIPACTGPTTICVTPGPVATTAGASSPFTGRNGRASGRASNAIPNSSAISRSSHDRPGHVPDAAAIGRPASTRAESTSTLPSSMNRYRTPRRVAYAPSVLPCSRRCATARTAAGSTSISRCIIAVSLPRRSSTRCRGSSTESRPWPPQVPARRTRSRWIAASIRARTLLRPSL
jgi:hypothetical protein